MSPTELLTRAVSNVTPRDLAEKKLQSSEPLRLYLGIDPTGNKLHLGHSVPLRKLKAFQDAGHQVIFLIGSYTAMIGDPTGRDQMREPLTREQVEENCQTYKNQAGKILDVEKIEFRYNHEWFDTMSGAEIMQLMSHFTVQQMLERDMFKERMKWKVVCPHCRKQFDSPLQFQDEASFKTATIQSIEEQCPHCKNRIALSHETIIPPPNPISPTEFLYPLMQGYDSVMLDVDCEIGGNDQYFNMLCGRKLQKKYGKREKFILTTKLIEGTDGRKMSKTYDNCIWLEDTATDIYGKVMRIKDDLMETYFECTTDVPMEEVQEILKGNPREAKARLAHEVTALYHGDEATQKAEEEFNSVFANKQLPSDMPEVQAEEGTLLLDVLVKQGIIASKSDGRRLLEQKAIKRDDKPITDIDVIAMPGVYKVGKRKFLKIS